MATGKSGIDACFCKNSVVITAIDALCLAEQKLSKAKRMIGAYRITLNRITLRGDDFV